MPTTFSPARINLIHLEHQLQVLRHVIENEQKFISFVNVIETCQPNFFAADKDYLEKLRADATRNIKKLDDEMKILQLKYMVAKDALTDDDREELPW